MADKQEKAVFIPFGGMNQDDSYINPSPDGDGRSAFEGGDFRYALNFRTGSTKGDSLGDGESIKSSLEITAYKTWNGSAWVAGAIPTGTNTPVGKIEDRQLRSVFYIYHSSTGNHTIIQYKQSDQTAYELLKWDGLNLDTTYISMSRIGNYVIFTNKLTNKPRIIDYTTIHTLKATLGTKFCEYHISFSKWAPVMPIRAQFGPPGTLNQNLAKGLFQFSYRYLYIGGFRSRWSPVSNGVSNLYLNGSLETIGLYLYGLIYNSKVPNTPINHNHAEFYEVVDKIEIAFRASAIDVWRIFKTAPVTNIGLEDNLYLTFDNRSVGTPVDPDDFSQDYDEVPLRSAACEVIDNRVVFGNNLIENTFIDDVDFVEGIAIYQSTQVAWWNYIAGVFSALSVDDDYHLINMNKLRQQSLKSRGIYKLGVEFKDETGKKSLVYTTDSWIYTIPDNSPNAAFFEPYYALGFKFKDTFFPPDWATSYQIVRTNCLNIDMFGYGPANRFVYLVDDTPVTTDQVTNPETVQAVIREFYDVSTTPFDLSGRLGAQVRKTKESGTSSGPTDLAKASRVYIDINNWLNAPKDNGSDTDFPLNKLFYNYEQGDRVRFFGSATAAPTIDQIVVYDLLITEFTGRGIIVEKPTNLIWLPQEGTDVSAYWIVEVYRPKKEIKKEDLIYYEMGEAYPITNPKAVSRDFLKRDWTWTDETGVTATLYGSNYAFHKLPVFYGDVHMIKRDLYHDYAVARLQFEDSIVPSMNPDKEQSFGRWERNNGRANTAYTTIPVVEYVESEARFGGKYLQDALFNNINNFVPRDRYLYPQEYGAITEMINTTSYQVESVGSILLILASVKSFSVYVNRTTLEDLGGRTQFFLSDKVLGSYNSLLGDNGCINPESLTDSGKGNVYWWDQFNGCWVRYGRDGNTDISGEYKMENWFKELAELIDPYYETETPPKVIAEFDPFHAELITYISHPSLPATFRGYANYKGMVFNEKTNQWKYAHSYAPQMFARVNNVLLALVNNKLYRLEGGTTYRTLLGTKYPVMVEPVFNKNPTQVKTWMTIAEIASHKWSIERTLSEYIGSRDYQESYLDLVKLTEKEFSFYSELMCDMHTPNITDEEVAAATGDKLRSKVLRVLLTLDDSVEVRSLLHQVIIGYSDSPKNA